MATVQLAAPTVWIHPEDWDRITNYADLSPGEYSLLGLVEEEKDSKGAVSLTISELFFPKQRNTSSSTEMDDGDIANILIELVNRNDGSEAKLKAWIHSHGNMAPFWSGTDTGTITKLVNSSYVVSLVVNKDRKYKLRVDVFSPFNDSSILGNAVKVITFDDQYLNIMDADWGTREECEAIFKEKATWIPTVVTTTTKGSNRRSYGSRNWGRNSYESGYSNFYGSAGWESDYDWPDDPDFHALAEARIAEEDAKNGVLQLESHTHKEDADVKMVAASFKNGVDLYDAEELSDEYSQLNYLEVHQLLLALDYNLLDDDKYIRTLNAMVEGKELSDVLGKEWAQLIMDLDDSDEDVVLLRDKNQYSFDPDFEPAMTEQDSDESPEHWMDAEKLGPDETIVEDAVEAGAEVVGAAVDDSDYADLPEVLPSQMRCYFEKDAAKTPLEVVVDNGSVRKRNRSNKNERRQ